MCIVLWFVTLHGNFEKDMYELRQIFDGGVTCGPLMFLQWLL